MGSQRLHRPKVTFDILRTADADMATSKTKVPQLFLKKKIFYSFKVNVKLALKAVFWGRNCLFVLQSAYFIAAIIGIL